MLELGLQGLGSGQIALELGTTAENVDVIRFRAISVIRARIGLAC